MSANIIEDTLWESKPKVSVLVAAWNEAEIIQDHITSFLKLRYAPKRLVLCAGGDDGTFDVARRYSGEQITVIEQQRGEGKQKSLRRALALADGDVFLLTDADCLFTDESFEKVLAPVVNGNEAVATGIVQPLPGQRTSPFVLQRWFNEVWRMEHNGHERQYVTGVMGANTAIRRDVLENVGGFNADVSSGTDYHLAKRLLASGYHIRYVPESVVYTLYVDSFTSYCRQQSRWLRNVVLHGLRFRVYSEVVQGLLPSLLGISMLSGSLLLFTGGDFRWVMPLLPSCFPLPEHSSDWLNSRLRTLRVLWGLAWLYVLLRRLRYIRVAERVTGERFPKLGYIYLPFYILMDFTVWSWALMRYIFKGGRSRW
jgi:cellulose synthase/poly-beta-1,6-N-acetylglucosamine synthase-like glycosyltransferase